MTNVTQYSDRKCFPVNIILYIPHNNDAGGQLLDQLSSLIKDNEVEVVHLLSSLTSRLQRPRFPHDIALLMPPDKPSLTRILELYLGHLMDDLQLVIILPEQQDELLNIAHLMFPRYLTDINADFSDVEATLYNLMICSCLKKYNFS